MRHTRVRIWPLPSIFPWVGEGLGWVRVTRGSRASRVQLLAHPLVHDLRVRLPARLLHHLAHEEAEQALLAAAVGLDLLLVLAEDPVDHRVELAHVRDRGLGEVALR